MLEDHEWQLAERQQQYGTNEMAIPVKSIAALVADEMWHPFYVFQYFSVIVWVAGDQYYIYAVCIFLITWFSIITSAVETHRNMRRLADMAHYTCMVGAGRRMGVGFKVVRWGQRGLNQHLQKLIWVVQHSTAQHSTKKLA